MKSPLVLTVLILCITAVVIYGIRKGYQLFKDYTKHL